MVVDLALEQSGSSKARRSRIPDLCRAGTLRVRFWGKAERAKAG